MEKIMSLDYTIDDVVGKNWIRLHAPNNIFDTHVIINSPATGANKLFSFCDIRTEMLEARHEGWDGEEIHRIYNDVDGNGITLELWKGTNENV